MKIQIVTTITTLIDVTTFTPEHSIEIVPEPGVPEAVARAAVLGAARGLIQQLDTDQPTE